MRRGRKVAYMGDLRQIYRVEKMRLRQRDRKEPLRRDGEIEGTESSLQAGETKGKQGGMLGT